MFQWLFIFDTFQKIAKVSTKKQREVKSHGTCANLTIVFLIYKVVQYVDDFWNLFLDKVYLKNNNNSSRGKMSFIQFQCVNVKGNWTHLAEKNS